MCDTGGTAGAGAAVTGADVGVATGVVTVDMRTAPTGSAIGMVISGISIPGTVLPTLAGLVGAVLTCYLLIAGEGLAS